MRIKKALPFLMWGTWPPLTSAFQDASISMVSLGDHPSFNYWPSGGQEALPCSCLMEMAQSWECRDLRFLDDTHPLCDPGHRNALPARTPAVSEKGSPRGSVDTHRGVLSSTSCVNRAWSLGIPRFRRTSIALKGLWPAALEPGP